MYIYKRVNGNNTTGHFNLIKPFCDRYKFLDRQTYSGHDMITTPRLPEPMDITTLLPPKL